MAIHNCHIHTFTSKAVPDRVLPFRIVQLTRSRFCSGLTRRLLRLLPFRLLDRAAAFVGIGSKRSQEEIFQEILPYYPRDTRFVILPMDFEFMEAGTSPQSYVEQLEELRALPESLKEEDRDRILPFVAADPRRPNVTELVLEYLEQHQFAGVKIYPPLGYYPFDERLSEIYAYCEERGVPVMAHCSRGEAVYFKGRITPEMRRHPKNGKVFTERSNHTFANHFTAPDNYTYLLEDFPRLKVCLAHYGGDDEWHRYLRDPWPGDNVRESWLSVISELMRDHPNVYADISYTAADRELWPLLKVLLNTPRLQDRVLFGSDFYMVRIKTKERAFTIDLRAAVGEAEFQRMAVTNATEFLQRT